MLSIDGKVLALAMHDLVKFLYDDIDGEATKILQDAQLTMLHT
jgi:hypothetical protein